MYNIHTYGICIFNVQLFRALNPHMMLNASMYVYMYMYMYIQQVKCNDHCDITYSNY